MLPGKRAKMEAEPSTTRSTREAETSAATVEHAVNQEITLSLGDGRVDAVFNHQKARYQHTVTYESSEPFALTSTPRTDGVFKVRQVVVLRAVPFRFLDLPPELRNMIYGYTFNGYGSNGPSKIDIHATSEKTELFGWYDTCFEGSKPTMRLGLLTTCRKIHKETASLFYGSQTFQIRTNQLYHFLSRLPLHIKYIRKVEISQPYSLSQPPMGKLKKGLRLLTGMEHLEHLQIDTWNLGARSTEWYALLLKEFLSTMQEKVNDREALCRKITFAKDYKGTLDDKLNFGDFLEAAFLYLKDKPELGVPEDTEPEGHLIPARRDTGRPRRSVVASKVISYAEDD